MFRKILVLLVVLLLDNSTGKSPFEFSDEARAVLCPFVGTKGMQCFDGEPIKRSGRQLEPIALKLPRGVGISIDRSTGRLKAPAVQLTYSPETGRTWTDGYTDEMFDVFTEVILSPATRAAAAYNASRIQTFLNASQLNAVWRQTYVDGKIRGGLLAQPPDLYKYMNKFSKHDYALVLFQSVTGLYVLTMNPSTMQLNSFARDALSKLTSVFDPDLYEDFVDKWGTHIVTKSLIGGMIEEQAKVLRCFTSDEHNSVVQCLPFGDSLPSGSVCSSYTDQNRIILKHRLGGNIQANNHQEWKKSLSLAPAMLQILEMVPWYDLVTDESIKRNLHIIARYRQNSINSNQNEAIRLIDSRLSSCVKVIPDLPANAQWEQNGITVAGGNGQGSNSNQLHYPHGLFVDDDDDQTVFIADCNNHRIIQWKRGDAKGKVVAGGNGLGSRLDQLHCPVNVLIDRMTNSLIIADRENRRVVRWFLCSGTIQGEILISHVYCDGLAMDEQRNLYVTNPPRHEVRRYEINRGDQIGTVVAGGNGQGSALNQLNCGRYISLDRNQSLYVSELYNHRVTKWDKGAKQGVVIAGGRDALTQLSHPHEIFVDRSGNLYVTEDGENPRITRWPQGSKQGTVVVGGNGRGGRANQFSGPHSLSFDKYGNLYVVDFYNQRVQRFTIVK